MVWLTVLTEGFATPNGRSFLAPLLRWETDLRDAGVGLKITTDPTRIAADVLFIDSKFLRDRWDSDAEGVLADLDMFRSEASRVVFCDTGDSAGLIQSPVLQYVDVYAKSTLYRDRRLYSRSLYGGRAFTDWYHAERGVVDRSPVWSQPVRERDLAKLVTLWNQGLADHSLFGPLKLSAYNYLRWKPLLNHSRRWHPADSERPIDVSARWNLKYPRETVAFQREQMNKILGKSVKKTSRRVYWREMQMSKVVVSPFGWGELTLKDFEIFRCGALMLKPDLKDIETYPDLFQAYVTYVPISWELNDFKERLCEALGDSALRLRIAAEGQRRYREHVASPEGRERFIRRVLSLVSG